MKYLKTYESFDKEKMKNSLERTYFEVIQDKVDWLYKYLDGDTVFNPPISLRSLAKRGWVDILITKMIKKYGDVLLLYKAKGINKNKWVKEYSSLNGSYDSFSVNLEDAIQKRYPEFEEWYIVSKEAEKFNM